MRSFFTRNELRPTMAGALTRVKEILTAPGKDAAATETKPSLVFRRRVLW